MLRLAICDDEQEYRDLIHSKTVDYFASSDFKVSIEIFSSAEELLADGKTFDIALLDVELKGISGIDTAQILNERNEDTVIVFISSHVKYSPIGYRLNATRYILKNSLDSSFEEAMDASLKIIESKRETIAVTYKQSIVSIRLEDIIYVLSAGRAVEFYLASSDEPIVCYKKINELEDILLSKGFIRCHQSYLINHKYILSFSSKIIDLTDGTQIPVSKARRDEAKRKYILLLG